jgi:hypothetical protein
MSRISEQHDDLSTIHAILLGQRKVIVKQRENAYMNGAMNLSDYNTRIEVIDNLLLEFEAAGVVWPDNVVEGDFTKCWPKEL